MGEKQRPVCPAGCRGGFSDRQAEYLLTHAEIVSVRGIATTDAWQDTEPVRRCTYCGCVYASADAPVVLGFKDFEPAGAVSWVPARQAAG